MTRRSKVAMLPICLFTALLLGISSLHAEDVPSAPDDESDKVGTTPADFSVDGSGAATYSIPIFTAPAPAGVAPQIALSYSSRGGHGALGVGWGISGTSSIERCRKTKEHGDSAADAGKPISWTDSDAYCLDGQRLVAPSTATGCPMNVAGYTSIREFRTELNSFARICAYYGLAAGDLTGVTDALKGPARFTVERRDGSIAEYGFTGDSRVEPNSIADAEKIAMRWALNRVRQPTGAYVDYVYVENSGVGTHQLWKVKFAGRVDPATPYGADAATPKNHIEFTYEDMPDAERVDFLAGSQVSLKQRLKSVSSHGVDPKTSTVRELRKYTITYDENTAGSGLPRIAQIQECGSNHSETSVCREPTIFGWQTAERGYGASTSQFMGAALVPFINFKPADLNGDGRQDFISIHDATCNAVDPGAQASAPRFVMRRMMAIAPVAGKLAGLDNPISSSVPAVTTTTTLPTCSSSNYRDIRLATRFHVYDFNDDGRDDVLTELNGNIIVYRSNSVGAFDLASAPAITVATGSLSNSRMTDFTGDGLPDLMLANSTEIRVLQMKSTGAPTGLRFGFESTALTVQVQNAGGTVIDAAISPNEILLRSPEAFDLNGDGRADLLARFQPTASGGTTYVPPANSANTKWTVFASQGVSGGVLALRVVLDTGVTGIQAAENVEVNDLNGDGLTDVVIRLTDSIVNVNDVPTIQLNWRAWFNKGGATPFGSATEVALQEPPSSTPRFRDIKEPLNKPLEI